MSLTTQFSANEIFEDTEESLSLDIFEDGGAATAVSSASYILYSSGNAEKASGDLMPVANKLTVSIASTVFTEIEEDCRVQWKFMVSGVAYKFNNLFDVVKNKIINCVTDVDLKKYHPDLADDLWATQTNYEKQIQQAFIDVKTDIKNKGNRCSLLIDFEQIKPLIILKTFVMIFYGFTRNTDDIWWARFEKEMLRYKAEFNNTRFKYDRDEDNTIDIEKSFGNVDLKR